MLCGADLASAMLPACLLHLSVQEEGTSYPSRMYYPNSGDIKGSTEETVGTSGPHCYVEVGEAS